MPENAGPLLQLQKQHAYEVPEESGIASALKFVLGCTVSHLKADSRGKVTSMTTSRGKVSIHAMCNSMHDAQHSWVNVVDPVCFPAITSLCCPQPYIGCQFMARSANWMCLAYDAFDWLAGHAHVMQLQVSGM